MVEPSARGSEAEPLKVLLVDDERADYLLTRSLFLQMEGGPFALEWVDTYDAALAALLSQPFAVCLVDYRLGARDGVELVREARGRGDRTPIILLTGMGDHRVDVAAMEAGAADYLLKGEITAPLLERSIRYALEHRRTERNLERRVRQQAAVAALGQQALGETDLPSLLREAAALSACSLEVEFAGVAELLPDGTALRMCAGFGWSPHVVEQTLVDAGAGTQAGYTLLRSEPTVVDDFAEETRFQSTEVLREHGIVSSAAVIVGEADRPFGVLSAFSRSTRRFGPDDVYFLQTVANVLGTAIQRKRADEQLRLQESALGAVPHGIVITAPSRPDNPIIYANPAFERISGYRASQIVGRNCRFLQGPRTDRETVAALRAAIEEGRPHSTELLNYHQDGSPFWNALAVSPIRDPSGAVTHYVGVLTDVTQRRELEAQVLQSQKMEAVGKLAGGVAHDFNNVLAVISGYSELLALRLGDSADEHVRSGLQEIARAGERATGLTRQLLAFSRKQVLEPKVLDIRDVVANMERMLRRLISEDIILSTVAEPEVGRIKADPGQVEQCLLNLVVNSRDAMPAGGEVTISISNAQLDGPQFRPGCYVRLAVRDEGCGMSADVAAQAFEPFFTTKPVGQGTGLGLSTVYGIVQQSDGYMRVRSEPGQGTTIELYFPCVSGASTPESGPRSLPVPRGSETVLLVEDEAQVRGLVRSVLESKGYTVLEASDGPEALRLVEERTAPVDLLLTDMVMPGGMSGRDLAERLTERQPGLKVLYTSGYTDDPAVIDGVRDADVAFIAKPFTPSGLARKVREVLG